MRHGSKVFGQSMGMLQSWRSRNEDYESDIESEQRRMTREEKGEEVVCGGNDEDRTDCVYYNDLQYQLVKSFHWSGNFLKDLGFFICNWHPFLGMFLSHPNHPWGKRERILTFFVSCSLSLLPSALLIRDMSDDGFTGFETQSMIFLSISLPVMIFETALYWLAVGDVFCRGGMCQCLTWPVACVRNACFCFTLSVSSLALLLSLVTLKGDDPLLLVRPLLISRLQAYITWFPLYLFLPCVGFVHVWLMEKAALSR